MRLWAFSCKYRLVVTARLPGAAVGMPSSTAQVDVGQIPAYTSESLTANLMRLRGIEDPVTPSDM